MPAVNSMLGLFGLATRRQLESAVDRKDRWHGLVRNVFVPYYLKFQETALGNMPELPTRYSRAWDDYIQAELDRFLSLDLTAVGDLLEAAGFGTKKWERLQETGFPALGRLLDQAAAVGAADIDAAVHADILDLLSRHPELASEIVRCTDPDSGTLRLTEDDIAGSPAYQRLLADLATTKDELRRFRRGGQRAVERLHDLEAELLLSRNGNGHLPQDLPRPPRDTSLEDEREKAGLRKQLRAQDSSIAALRGRVEELETQVRTRPDPDRALADRAGWLERELETRDDQVVRLQERVEGMQDALDKQDHTIDESDELRQLRLELKKRDHDLEQARDSTIDALRAELERAEERLRSANQRPESRSDGDLTDDVQRLRSDLKAREHTIVALREELARSKEDPGTPDRPEGVDAEDLSAELQQLHSNLKVREHSIEALQEQVARLEADARRETERPTRGPGAAATTPATLPARSSAPDPQPGIDALARDLRARDATIEALREQLQTFERELGQSRELLMAEVKKLAALAAGEIELRPAEELESLGADELMDYARQVAEDLDVRRQTLDQGLLGVESVKGSYEDTKRIFEEQQLNMETQLEQLRTEVEQYREQEETTRDETPAELRDTVVQQRSQLELLATRVRQLVGTNKELNESNKKMYSNLEEAVKKVIPLRRQIEELESLQDTLQRFIRQKYDRTFTMRQLQEAGLR
ncbi:MAG: hypothetical protein O2782_00465 [bacterium]|nr:hypothetical protein [bacterium]